MDFYMAWIYLPLIDDGDDEYGYDTTLLPSPGTIYLALDRLRASVVIGYTERGGISSFFNPNICDDCNIVAFANLGEMTEPDFSLVPNWDGKPSYKSSVPKLMRRSPARKDPE
jgi:hypothetical protein